jgi:hypothetical protein
MGMWLVLLVVVALIVAVMAFSFDRSDSVVDQPTAPAATAPDQSGSPTPADSDVVTPDTATPDATGNATVPPTDPGIDDGAAPVDPPAPGTAGETPPAEP